MILQLTQVGNFTSIFFETLGKNHVNEQYRLMDMFMFGGEQLILDFMVRTFELQKKQLMAI